MNKPMRPAGRASTSTLAKLGGGDEAAIYNLRGLTILVVDDSPFMCSILTSMLKAFEVGRLLTAGSIEEAKQMFKVSAAAYDIGDGRMSIDIAVIDWLLPEGKGTDLLRWVRQQESEVLKFLPVIIMSGYSHQAVVEEARDAGANEFLAKPVSISSMVSKLMAVIDRPRPFVQAPQFFGPDRRRRQEPPDGPDRRRTAPDQIEVAHEPD